MVAYYFLILLSVSLASAATTCPDITSSQGCKTGSCKDVKKHPNTRWNIPTDVPLLVGYGTSAFYLTGNISDDSQVDGSSLIKASQRKNFTSCCRKCKLSKTCKFFQFLNLGAYKGLCLTYFGTKKPYCSDHTLVKTRVGAKCQNTSLVNDPHLVGAHGTKFDFSGVPGKSYCLISDKELNINMKMTGYMDSRTESATVIKDGKAVRSWVRELGINWRVDAWDAHTLRIVARSGGKVERGDGYLAFFQYNGDEFLPKMAVGSVLKREGELTITYVAVEKNGPYDVDFYRVQIGNLLDMDVRLRVAHPLLRTANDAEAHISMGFNYIANTPQIHGVLGQTYRAGRESRDEEFQKLTAMLHRSVGADSEEGKGYLDGTPADYVTSDVMTPDCKYSAYQGWATDLVLVS